MTESGSIAWYLRSERDGTGKFNIGNSENRLTIGSSGNVGIGVTPSTGYKLHIRRDTDAAIGFGLQSSEPSIEAVNDAVSANVPLRIYGSELKYYTSATERMRIDSSGNVGVGTTSPSTKLHVYESNALDHITIDGNNGDNRNLRFATENSTRWNLYATGTYGNRFKCWFRFNNCKI